jgi:hypothetical protein
MITAPSAPDVLFWDGWSPKNCSCASRLRVGRCTESQSDVFWNKTLGFVTQATGACDPKQPSRASIKARSRRRHCGPNCRIARALFRQCLGLCKHQCSATSQATQRNLGDCCCVALGTGGRHVRVWRVLLADGRHAEAKRFVAKKAPSCECAFCWSADR